MVLTMFKPHSPVGVGTIGAPFSSPLGAFRGHVWFLRRCVMNAALKCGRSTLVSLAPVFFGNHKFLAG